MENEPETGQTTELSLPTVWAAEQQVEGMTGLLSPELKLQIETALSELNDNLVNNREGSVMVFREDGDATNHDETLARQVMMAGLGVRDFQVEEYPSDSSSKGHRYLERIATNLPGVEIVYADLETGGRVISLAVNHDPSGQKRVGPTDIERVLRSAHTHEDWMESIEQFGTNWNIKQEDVRHARLLALDIDECVLPAIDSQL